ncbi:hypothetical protein [Streptomyces sp. NPDC053755]|uniref:hypothetical protein n=1 Tax=Streptomyces sp. NPDC053755 TaxID=3155815 RepID=UPI003425A8F7
MTFALLTCVPMAGAVLLLFWKPREAPREDVGRRSAAVARPAARRRRIVIRRHRPPLLCGRA